MKKVQAPRDSRSTRTQVLNKPNDARITAEANRQTNNSHFLTDKRRIGIISYAAHSSQQNDGGGHYKRGGDDNVYYGGDDYAGNSDDDNNNEEKRREEEAQQTADREEEAAEEDHDDQSEEELSSEEEDVVNTLTNLFHGLQNDQRLDFIKKMHPANKQKVAKEPMNDKNTPCMTTNDPVLAERTKSKGELAKGLAISKADHGITNTGMTAVLSVIHDCAPGLLLPIKVVEKSGVVQLKLDDYVGKDWRSIKVDVCPVGCTVYTGVNAKSIQCAECSMMRYTPCYRKSHKGGVKSRGAIFCDPSDGIHGVNHRAVNENYYYRPIIPLFQELIEWCIENGIDLFSFEKTRYQKDRELHDIIDAPQAQENLEEMQKSFEEKAKTTPGLRQFSFLLSEFYDGGTLFKRNSISVWPLIMSILNLTPSERLSYGIGLFLVALHCLKPGSVAEESLFDELFVKELQCLYEGFEYTFTSSDGEEHHIFLQARLIIHIMDTKALEEKAQIYGE